MLRWGQAQQIRAREVREKKETEEDAHKPHPSRETEEGSEAWSAEARWRRYWLVGALSTMGVDEPFIEVL